MSDESRTTEVPDTDRDSRSAEDAIIEARRAKATRLRERGENPSANDVAQRGPVDAIGEVRARAGTGAGGRFEAAEVERAAGGRPAHVCGRVVALRSAGGLSFARLRDRTGEIQLM